MIKEISLDKLNEALELVNRVFAEFVATDYSKQGQETFSNYLKHKYEEVSTDLASGHKKLWGYYIDDQIIGVIAIRNISHISLLFVNKEHHRKGIAKALFNHALEYIKNTSDSKSITVNSSPYAVSIYQHLGFHATDAAQEKDGIIFVPMGYALI